MPTEKKTTAAKSAEKKEIRVNCFTLMDSRDDSIVCQIRTEAPEHELILAIGNYGSAFLKNTVHDNRGVCTDVFRDAAHEWTGYSVLDLVYTMTPKDKQPSFISFVISHMKNNGWYADDGRTKEKNVIIAQKPFPKVIDLRYILSVRRLADHKEDIISMLIESSYADMIEHGMWQCQNENEPAYRELLRIFKRLAAVVKTKELDVPIEDKDPAKATAKDWYSVNEGNIDLYRQIIRYYFCDRISLISQAWAKQLKTSTGIYCDKAGNLAELQTGNPIYNIAALFDEILAAFGVDELHRSAYLFTYNSGQAGADGNRKLISELFMNNDSYADKSIRRYHGLDHYISNAYMKYVYMTLIDKVQELSFNGDPMAFDGNGDDCILNGNMFRFNFKKQTVSDDDREEYRLYKEHQLEILRAMRENMPHLLGEIPEYFTDKKSFDELIAESPDYRDRCTSAEDLRPEDEIWLILSRMNRLEQQRQG